MLAKLRLRAEEHAQRETTRQVRDLSVSTQVSDQAHFCIPVKYIR